jgi:hypothetical protein
MQALTTSGLNCPSCNGTMQGFTLGLQHYECPNCGIARNDISINSNSIQGVLAALCIVGFIVLVSAALN